MSTPSANDTVEYLKIGFSFGGALLGAIIGTPLIEWFKDHLGAKRQWKTQRNDIVATIRLISGILRGFDELRAEAFGFRWAECEYSQGGFERLSKFDFTLLDESLSKLSALHPEESSRSAAAQRLIQHLVVLKIYFQQLQTLPPVEITRIPGMTKCLGLSVEDMEILKLSDQKYIAFQRFLGGIYARRMGIDALSLSIDREIMAFEDAMAQHDQDEIQERLRKSLEDLNAERAADA